MVFYRRMKMYLSTYVPCCCHVQWKRIKFAVPCTVQRRRAAKFIPARTSPPQGDRTFLPPRDGHQKSQNALPPSLQWGQKAERTKTNKLQGGLPRSPSKEEHHQKSQPANFTNPTAPPFKRSCLQKTHDSSQDPGNTKKNKKENTTSHHRIGN